MPERPDAVTMKGNPLTLLGNELKVGDAAPDCALVAPDLSEVKLSSFKGKTCIISVVPSLDTSVCNLQTRRFNEEAGKLDNITVVTVSMDLPFAQKRWAEEAGVKNIRFLSDHRDASFGEAYGVLVKGLRLLARTVFVVDPDGKIRHIEPVKELTEEPNYEAVLESIQKTA